MTHSVITVHDNHDKKGFTGAAPGVNVAIIRSGDQLPEGQGSNYLKPDGTLLNAKIEVLPDLGSAENDQEQRRMYLCKDGDYTHIVIGNKVVSGYYADTAPSRGLLLALVPGSVIVDVDVAELIEEAWLRRDDGNRAGECEIESELLQELLMVDPAALEEI